MDDLSRALLKYHGRDRAMQRLRDLVRFGHQMTVDQCAFAERALAGPDVERISAFGRTAEENETVVKVGQPESVEVWDPGTYPAKVVSCEVTKSTFPGKEDTNRFKWVIRVKDEQTDEYTDIWHFTNATLSNHKLATFRPMARALLPEADLDGPDGVDTDDMVGKRCRVILGVNDEKGRNTVEKILPYQAAAGRRQAAPPPSDEDEPAPTRRQPVAAGARRSADDDPDALPF